MITSQQSPYNFTIPALHASIPRLIQERQLI